MGINGADLKNESLLQIFAAVCGTLMKGKAANRHVFFRMVREIKMPRDWFGCVFVFYLGYAAFPMLLWINCIDAAEKYHIFSCFGGEY